MSHTPKSKINRLQCRIKKDKKGQSENKSLNNTSTPVARRSFNKNTTDEECVSPIHIRCTQDGGEDDLDVVWDWNSPQSKINRNFNKFRKRIPNNVSPKIPRKLLSQNHIPRFNSLRAELEILANKLRPEDDDISIPQSCLIINLPEENGVNDCDSVNNQKITSDLNVNKLEVTESNNNAFSLDLSLDDLFGDDSLDAEMIKCSQQVEEAYIKSPPVVKSIAKVLNETFGDDSFDAVLEDFTDEDIALLSQTTITSSFENDPVKQLNISPPLHGIKPIAASRTIVRTNSTPERPADRVCRTSAAASVFPRTKSMGDAAEITCSYDEIEKKRLEARGRLELKKKQNEIERKRQEAMERLKKNRFQRMLNKQTQ